MEKLSIQTHDFENAKNEIKAFSNSTPSSLKLSKFRTSEGLFDLFNHKVTGDELNNFVAKVQEYLVGFNERDKDFIKEFGQVYNALESLDKDYIQAIIISVKSAEKASQEAKNAQKDIDRTIEALKKTINVLSQFKNKIDKIKHLTDIDSMWGDVKSVRDKVSSYITKTDKAMDTLTIDINILKQFKNKVGSYKHLDDIDTIWDDIQCIKDELKEFAETYAEIDKKLESFSKDVDFLNKEVKALNDKTQDIEALKLYIETLKGYSHLGEVDEEWEYSHNFGKTIDTLSSKADEREEQLQNLNESISEIRNKYEVENKALSRKLKVSYLIAGSSLALVILQIILNMVGIM